MMGPFGIYAGALLQAAGEQVAHNWPLFLIPLFPLIGVIINAFFTRRAPEKLIGVIGSLAIGASFVVSVVAFLKLLQLPVDERLIINKVYSWLSSGDLDVPARAGAPRHRRQDRDGRFLGRLVFDLQDESETGY